jgi:hypothetical protein
MIKIDDFIIEFILNAISYQTTFFVSLLFILFINGLDLGECIYLNMFHLILLMLGNIKGVFINGLLLVRAIRC